MNCNNDCRYLWPGLNQEVKEYQHLKASRGYHQVKWLIYFHNIHPCQCYLVLELLHHDSDLLIVDNFRRTFVTFELGRNSERVGQVGSHRSCDWLGAGVVRAGIAVLHMIMGDGSLRWDRVVEVLSNLVFSSW